MNKKNDARLVVLEALIKMDKDNAYSNIAFNNIIKSSNLDARDIAFASRLFYGVIEKRITLDYVINYYSKRKTNKISNDILNILRMGIYQIVYMNKVPNSASVNQSVQLARKKKKESATGFVNGILRSFIRDGSAIKLPEINKNEINYLEIKYSCPKKLINHLIKNYGYETTINMLELLDYKSHIWIRTNTIKTNKMQLLKDLQDNKIKTLESHIVNDAIGIQNISSIENNDNFNNGDFHVQNLSSQICCQIISPKPTEKIYDVCAAPGGKSFTLAEIMENKGEIQSFDIHNNKIKLINDGANRLGISIIKASCRDASLDDDLPKADRVVCDVPCSGIGVIKQKPEIRYRIDLELDKLVKLQYIILCKSSKLVKSNGFLFYSTCTLNKQENDYNVARFLKEHKEFTGYKINKENLKFSGIDEPDYQLTIPIGKEVDGFFIAAFQKTGA